MTLIRVTTAPAQTPRAVHTAKIAQLLGITTDVQLAQLGELAEEVTDQVERVLDFKCWYRTYEEYVEGDGTDKLYLGAKPLVSVSEVVRLNEDPLVEADGTDDEDDEFRVWHDQGFLELPNCWGRGRPHWKVTYTAGWWIPSMGDDVGSTGAKKLEAGFASLARAVQETVRLNWQLQQGDQTISSARLGSMSVTYRSGLTVPKGAHATLQAHRKRRF